VEQESLFCCHLDANSDIENDKLLKYSFFWKCVRKLEDVTGRRFVSLVFRVHDGNW
jgi:hypothetical protein